MNQPKNNCIDKNMNFHLFDSTVKFYAFEFNSYNCSHNGVNGVYRVAPLVKTIPFMYETLWLVFIKVEIKWPKVENLNKTFKFS